MMRQVMPAENSPADLLAPGFKVGDSSGPFCIGHIGVATNHLNFAIDEGTRLRTVFVSLRRLAGENVAHIDNRAGRFGRLLDYHGRLRRGVDRHFALSAPPGRGGAAIDDQSVIWVEGPPNGPRLSGRTN